MIYGQQAGAVNLVMMTESSTLQKISAYVAENRMIAALEVEVKYVASKANEQVLSKTGPGKDFDPEPPDLEIGRASCRERV